MRPQQILNQVGNDELFEVYQFRKRDDATIRIQN